MDIYGPLSRDYCFWFQFLSIYGFIMMVLSILAFAMAMFSKKSAYTGVSFYMIITFFVFYFQNRLLHTMCLSSIKA